MMLYLSAKLAYILNLMLNKDEIDKCSQIIKQLQEE
jgi:hypothetical protein